MEGGITEGPPTFELLLLTCNFKMWKRRESLPGEVNQALMGAPESSLIMEMGGVSDGERFQTPMPPVDAMER